MAQGRILLGTASWTDKPLIDSGRFYPRTAKSAEDRLRYYASQYPLVEVDTTYYGLPSEQMVRAWEQRTPDNFVFDVKAFSLFTDHPTPIVRLPPEIREQIPPALREKKNLYRSDAPPEVIDMCWATYIDALAPLHESGKLGVSVFQLPKWMFPNHRNERYLEEVRRRLGPYRGAVEFRNETWMRADERESTLSMLGDLDFSYISVDEPQGFKSSVPPVAAATNDLAFVRFHGRNAEMWEARTKTSSERFDYWYSAEELDEWVPRIATLAGQAREVHLIMNTNNYDEGPVNLNLLGERLDAAGLEVVHRGDAQPRLMP